MIAAQAQRYPSEFEAKTMLIACAARIAGDGWTPAGDGTLSVRTGPGTVWVTAAGTDKRSLTQKELLRVDLRGSQSQVGRNGIPPDDLMVHLRIYLENSGVVSILHAYPPEASAWGMGGEGVPALCGTPSVTRLGPVGIIGVTEAFRAPELAAMAAANGNGILLQNDGVLTWGNSPLEACQKMEALEYSVSMMNKQKCANCGRCAAAGTHKCGQCTDSSGCTKGLKGVTPIVRPGDAIPDRKAAQTAAQAPVQQAAPAAARGKIPELTITPHRFTDREKQKAGQAVQPQQAQERPAGPVVHRFSDAAAAKKTAARPAPAVKAAEPAAPAPVAAAVIAQPAPRTASVPVKDVPRASVQAEVVRRLKGKL